MLSINTRLFVGNVPENTQEKELHTAFSDFGKITTLDLKQKNEPESKKFAFISISASNQDVESCISYFANKDFKGTRLYVTRARESFLERLQRERDETARKEGEKPKEEEKKDNVKKGHLIKTGDNLRKRKRDISESHDLPQRTKKHVNKKDNLKAVSDIDHRSNKNGSLHLETIKSNTVHHEVTNDDASRKKHEAERKRMESLKKKRQEFKEKKLIIKTGLTGVDKVKNKKIIFADEISTPSEVIGDTTKNDKAKKRKSLFDNDNADDSDTEPNFNIKKQFEGKQGQKVLDLQSRYKSDKRFTLDERFVDEEDPVTEKESNEVGEEVELTHADEMAQQLNILQDVLGVTIKARNTETDNKKNKPKLGMLRFDPMQPEHAKFLAPIETQPDTNKKTKKNKKERQQDEKEIPLETNVPKVEVSKEQFYKVSDTLKEAIEQPNTFSLRSLFGNNSHGDDGSQEQEKEHIPLEKPKKEKKKVKNPLDPTEKNPFTYDSSDSETEEVETVVKPDVAPPSEPKVIWRESFFFNFESDSRLKDGLIFFNKTIDNDVQKERRELKSLVKKRMYNHDRKNQMFKKKIGGRKKTMKKTRNFKN